MQLAGSIKHFQYSQKSFYDALGDFEPTVIVLFVKSTNGHTKHQTYDYGRIHNVPVLTLYKGWSHLIRDAKEKGLNWIADAYPQELFIPPEDIESREKRKTKKLKRKVAPSPQLIAFNELRKEAFAKAGITDKDARFATMRYVQPKASRCILCNTKIKYQFGIDFTLPGEENITSFYPVGSTCIRSWVGSLPNNEERNRLVAQMEAAIAESEQDPPPPPRSSPAKKVFPQKKGIRRRKKKFLP
jgi:hypothetical protein